MRMFSINFQLVLDEKYEDLLNILQNILIDDIAEGINFVLLLSKKYLVIKKFLLKKEFPTK